MRSLVLSSFLFSNTMLRVAAFTASKHGGRSSTSMPHLIAVSMSSISPAGARKQQYRNRNKDTASGSPWLRLATIVSAGGATASISSASCDTTPPPPADKVDHEVKFGAVEGEVRGDNPMPKPIVLNDPLFWMRDDKRTDTKVIDRLKEENAHSAAVMEPLKSFQDKLYDELKSHLKETDVTSHYPKGSWQYFTRTLEGKSYAIHCRQKRGMVVGVDAEEIVLNENVLAEENTASSFTSVGALSVSPVSEQRLMYTVDTFGGETYDLVICDMNDYEKKPGLPKEVDRVKDVDASVRWGADDSTVYYLKMDEEHRPYQVWRHTISTDASTDELIFQEDNPLFWVSLDKTLDGHFAIITSASSETSEVHTVDLRQKGNAATVVAPRRQGVLYSVDHREGFFFVTTNEGKNKNFRLAVAPTDSPGAESWQALDEGIFADGSDTSPGAVMLDSVTCFKDFVAVEGRSDGFTKVWVMEMGEGARVKSYHQVKFDTDACSCGLSANAEFDTKDIRVGYSSLVDPPSTLSYNVEERKLNLVKQKEIPCYNPANYRTERVLVEAHDGAIVPVSLVFHKDAVELDENGLPKKAAPMHLYGYGSYGICIDPDFSAKRLPLLNRGMVYAIAHIRGGAEMGRTWYEDQGKYLNKRNTFMDFISCAETLHARGWSRPELTSTEGRSAGGLLMGACLNMRPDLFKVAVAGVPFVDLMTTMCDASIPLTVGEWEEWGNPNDARFFNYMLSYSPMNNILPQDYPSILVTAGLHDPRVAYWEPMKWVAKLREMKTDSNPLLLKVDLEAGHFSASDRYKYLKELSFDYAFLLDQLALKDSPILKK